MTSLQGRTIREMIESDRLILGLWIRSENSDFIEIMASQKFDFVYLDREHTTTDWNTLKKLAVTASSVAMPVLLRVEKNDDVIIRKAYEIGVQGVLIPHVRGLEDAEKAIYAAKFPPRGTRGMDTGVRSSRFADKSIPKYIEKSNRDTVIGALIEDKEGIDNIDEILSVKGLDFVCFGPGDYSVSIGEPGNYESPGVKEAESKMISKASSKGVRILRTVLDPRTAKEQYDKGVRCFILGSDMEIFTSGCKEKVTMLSNISKGK